MSELSEDFVFLREESMRKRAANRENSARILREKGIPFEEKSAGVHLILKARDGEPFADFWPGTGLWIIRATQRRGRGVFKLAALVTRGRA